MYYEIYFWCGISLTALSLLLMMWIGRAVDFRLLFSLGWGIFLILYTMGRF